MALQLSGFKLSEPYTIGGEEVCCIEVTAFDGRGDDRRLIHLMNVYGFPSEVAHAKATRILELIEYGIAWEKGGAR